MEWIWVGFLMILTGIPHGAADHLVYWHDDDHTSRKTWKSFFIIYLSQILLYGLVWWFFPFLSLIIFFVLTFYHFGQSELYYIDLPESHLLKKALYLFWGSGIMGVILLGHADETINYLQEIVPESILSGINWPYIYLPYTISVFSIWVIMMFFIWEKGQINFEDFIREIIVTVILGLCLHFSSLWIGFGLYFGLWHATKAIRAELTLLRQKKPSWNLQTWIIQAIPFTLLSFLGIGLLLTGWYQWGQGIHPVFIFFVGISILTLPHMTTLESLYKSLK